MITDLDVAAHLRDALADAVAAAFARRRAVLAATSIRVARMDILDTFRSGRAFGTRFFWHPPDSPALIGLGSALHASVRDPAAARRVWEAVSRDAVIRREDAACPDPRAFISLPFDPHRPATGPWTGVSAGVVVPRVLYVQSATVTYLVVSIVVQPGDDPEALVEGFQTDFSLLRGGTVPSESEVAGERDADYPVNVHEDSWWEDLVQSAVDAIRAGGLEKVVLARERPLDTYAAEETILERLLASMPTATVFALGGRNKTFLGATPEWLVRLDGGVAHVSCLAGTARRGQSRQEDEALGSALLNSPKNRHEHELVVRAVTEALHHECAYVFAPREPVLLKLPNVQHLSTPITASCGDAGVLRLAERLHPTPAVAGLPRESAMSFLRDNEDFDRGLYAGPIGWVGTDGEGELAVAIRSALLSGRRASVFAGCGIVADSQPAAELRESEVKMQPMISALGTHGAG